MFKEFLDSTLECISNSNDNFRLEPELRAVVSQYFWDPITALPLVERNKLLIDECIGLAEKKHNTTLSKIRNTKSIPFKPSTLNEPNFTFIDLFAGIGGFRLPLQALAGKCNFTSEWDKQSKETYFKNYGDYPFGDINQFTSDEISDKELSKLIPNHNLLAAGFPCQPFSLAGVSARESLGQKHGFECETQGTLFYSVARIANIKQPKILFLENVKNITSHNGGETFKTIKKTIDEIGYKFYYALINSNTVVPQNRIRCYMVCVRNDIAKELGGFEFPTFEGEPLPLNSILENSPDPMYTISDKLWKGHIRRTKNNIARGTGFTAHTADLNKPSKTIVARYCKDGKECLIPQVDNNPRLLTIHETVKIFGYPSNFVTPKARTTTYRQFGNSVVMPIVQKISEKIVRQYLS